MSRIIIPGARTASPARRVVLPDGLKGRASLSGAGTDDRVTGVDSGIRNADPWTMLCWAFRARNKNVGSWDGCMGMGNTAVANAAAYFGFTNPTAITAPRCQLGLRLTLVGGIRTVGIGWHRIVARYDGLNATLHEDGVQDGAAVPVVMAMGAGPCELLRFFSSNAYCGRVKLNDARIYSRAWTPAEVAADARGEAVSSTGLVRRWSCENPGYGTTCREEVGGTDDAITGAPWSPVVPFRRQRSVEDVPAAALGTGTLTCTVAHHADLDPAAGSFSFGLWTSARGVSGDIIAQKDDGAVGWILDFTAGGALRLRLRDGAVTITVTGSALLRSAWGDSDRYDRHVECTVDRAGGYAYLAVDGGPPARTALGALGSIANVADLVFGAGASGVVGGLNDAVFHKGASWSWDERDALYYNGKVPGGAIAWPMREGAGLTAVSQPAGYNGTLSAASWTTKTRCKARTAA